MKSLHLHSLLICKSFKIGDKVKKTRIHVLFLTGKYFSSLSVLIFQNIRLKGMHLGQNLVAGVFCKCPRNSCL